MKLIILLCLIITGCSLYPKPVPMPAPNKSRCDMMVRGECREMTAGEHAGAGSRGHSEEPKDIQ